MKSVGDRVTPATAGRCHALDNGVCLYGRAWCVQYDAGT